MADARLVYETPERLDSRCETHFAVYAITSFDDRVAVASEGAADLGGPAAAPG